MDMKSKRDSPSQTTIDWRSRYLAAARDIEPALIASDELPPSLELGNRKTGKSSRHFEAVYVWNLPAVATCPGASRWCLQHCYNADDREAVFPVNLWVRNWAWCLHRPAQLAAAVSKQLNAHRGSTAIRVHSSGDFYSNDYVDLWIGIANSSPRASFWAYTRSWAVPDLRSKLEELRSLNNFELFASWDQTMGEPPATWRRSLVYSGNPDALEESSLVCPEQSSNRVTCATCLFCVKRRAGDVLFALH
jgi:hypothetical protein